MTKTIAMPSPRGSNHERLFLPWPRMALDAAPPRRLARDQTQGPGRLGVLGMARTRGTNMDSDQDGSAVNDWLRAHLSPEDYQELLQLVGGDNVDQDDPNPREPSYAQDEAWRRDLEVRYPGINRLKRSL